MPFWAWYMIACVVLIVWHRKGDWITPAAILLGLIGVRFTPFFPPVWHEIASCAVWLFISALLLYSRRYIASVLIGLSAFVYLPLVVIGYRIEFLGLMPILSDLFLVAAIGASFGNGSRNRSIGPNSGNGHRDGGVVVAFSQSMAKGLEARPSFFRGGGG